jgi:transposase-like protein
MPRTRPPYPPAFRAEAVALLRTSGKPVPVIARDLGVSEQTLRNWLHQGDIDAGHGRPGELTTAEREELSQLRREVRTLQQEREILKKAAAFFAKETL